MIPEYLQNCPMIWEWKIRNVTLIRQVISCSATGDSWYIHPAILFLGIVGIYYGIWVLMRSKRNAK